MVSVAFEPTTVAVAGVLPKMVAKRLATAPDSPAHCRCDLALDTAWAQLEVGGGDELVLGVWLAEDPLGEPPGIGQQLGTYSPHGRHPDHAHDRPGRVALA